jgi:hypothetical protein
LANIRQRLKVIYGEAASLTVGVVGAAYVATVSLPTRTKTEE